MIHSRANQSGQPLAGNRDRRPGAGGERGAGRWRTCPSSPAAPPCPARARSSPAGRSCRARGRRAPRGRSKNDARMRARAHTPAFSCRPAGQRAAAPAAAAAAVAVHIGCDRRWPCHGPLCSPPSGRRMLRTRPVCVVGGWLPHGGSTRAPVGSPSPCARACTCASKVCTRVCFRLVVVVGQRG